MKSSHTSGPQVERYTKLTGSGQVAGEVEETTLRWNLKVSQDRSLLFAANAGSGEISVFRVDGSTPEGRTGF